jgi:hypothetical protein
MVRSLFVSPEPGNSIPVAATTDIQGIAFDGGDGNFESRNLHRSVVKPGSHNACVIWVKYSWRHWHLSDLTPAAKGSYYLQVESD